jgi:hypothetical protein
VRLDKPANMLRFEWWCEVVSAKHSGVQSALSWKRCLTYRVPRGRFAEAARLAALQWWNETDQSATCDVVIRVEDDAGHAHEVDIRIAPTVTAVVRGSKSSVFNGVGA